MVVNGISNHSNDFNGNSDNSQIIGNCSRLLNGNRTWSNSLPFGRFDLGNANRHLNQNLAYGPVEDDRNLFVEKAKNRVIKNFVMQIMLQKWLSQSWLVVYFQGGQCRWQGWDAPN